MEAIAQLSKDSRYQYLIAYSAAVALLTYVLIKYWSNSSPTKIKPNVVLLHTFAPTTNIVNPSPFGLKLQTYFRMTGNVIPCELEFTKPFGKNDKSPWVELDGESVSDSSLIIEFLNQRFNVSADDHLTEEQKALGRILQKTIEENTFWAVLAYNRINEDLGWFLNTAKNIPWIQQKIIGLIIPRRLQKNLYGHGIGRLTPEDIRSIGKKDLKAISCMLGDKPYFLGDKPSSFDAAIFGILANIIYALRETSWPQVFIREHCSNLIQFADRMRNKYWPDWNDILVK